jgi:RNA polymerase sigma-70 factor (sigma-E family)
MLPVSQLVALRNFARVVSVEHIVSSLQAALPAPSMARSPVGAASRRSRNAEGLSVLPVVTRRFSSRDRVLPVSAEEPDDLGHELENEVSLDGAAKTEKLGVEEMFTALYVAEYARLLRLAALLLDDLGSCEEIVQEAYIKVHAALSGPTSRLRDDDRALAYLRQTVVNLARSSLRRRLVARKHAPHPMPDAPSAEEGAYAQVERAAVVQALRGLPRRQREAVVLRYYGDLTEAAAAHVMGVSTGAVKAYTSRGLAGLKLALEELR